MTGLRRGFPLYKLKKEIVPVQRIGGDILA